MILIGRKNPLEKKKYHELRVYQRVWIMKGLCDYCMVGTSIHTHTYPKFFKMFTVILYVMLSHSYIEVCFTRNITSH